MALAMRLYGIISAAQKGTPTKEELGELTAEEAKMYDEIRQETLQLQAEGKPLPMYELPVDAFDDVYEDADIYSDHFDDDVAKDIEKLNEKE